MKGRGKFLVLEGGLGCGKTTKVDLLRKELTGWEFYREPGSTPFGEKIRDALLGEYGYDVNPYAELLAFSAARANLVREMVAPRLKKGINIVLDRYWYSSWAYQGARGVSKPLIWMISLVATKGLKPNLVLHYDLSPEVGKKQKKGLGDIDRLDVMDLEFHKRVQNNYLQLKKLYPKIWRTVDASRPVEEVFADSIKILKEYGLIC